MGARIEFGYADEAAQAGLSITILFPVRPA
jgi:hypothetical protein